MGGKNEWGGRQTVNLPPPGGSHYNIYFLPDHSPGAGAGGRPAAFPAPGGTLSGGTARLWWWWRFWWFCCVSCVCGGEGHVVVSLAISHLRVHATHRVRVGQSASQSVTRLLTLPAPLQPRRQHRGRRRRRRISGRGGSRRCRGRSGREFLQPPPCLERPLLDWCG